ncbi:MAG: molybdopterin molybdotransferase MoeA [Anaerolineae bacterium]|nr:molybdopterin molybdotransferase MoeA [Anaerolineae bacterium]MDQ7037420.1 molybdopterin molybdotransferase MoeA [Anaerolineae bacterium]
MSNLRNVDDAIADILSHIHPLGSEDIALPESLGRILAADIVSDINLPPFANSAMDGFAIKAHDSAHASPDNPTTLIITMDIPAGVTPNQALQSGEAARIMTGAPVPEGADAVIPVEATNADFSQLDLSTLAKTVALYQAASIGANIRSIGENIRIGQTILSSGTAIQPADIGILASIGKSVIPVIRKPRVVIIGTGDELVALDEPMTVGKIRDSNSYTLQALASQDGCETIRLPIAPDDSEAIRKLFNEALALKPDVIISSAGVSMGAADYVRAILDEMGEIDFWRINMRPGKPVAFGHLGSIPFFGLPGNPVSAMVTYDVIVRPALLKLAQKPDVAHIVSAIAGERMASDGRRTFARVTLRRENGELVAYATGTQSSGALISMVKADGLLIIPENIQVVEVGTSLEVRLIRPIH